MRSARPEEAPILSQLALESKGVWGYDAAFLEQCREELSVAPADIASLVVEVADEGPGQPPLGFFVLDPAGSDARLDKLYVAPGQRRRGVGARLWTAALRHAAARGAQTLTWDADPHAVPFYVHMGAVEIGRAPSGSIPGRTLPVMRVSFPERQAR
jgi:GNAT superfamily N-acetyltransferase